MKIYQHIIKPIVRLQIIQQGSKTEYLNLTECTSLEALNELKEVMKPHVEPFTKGFSLAINIRESIGSKNGKSISFSFKGLNPQQVLNIIVKHIENKKY